MILSCSSCNARYLVASSSIGLEGRTVKCAKCSHQWFQDANDEGEEVDLSALSKVLQDDDQDYENDIRVPDIDAIADEQEAEEENVAESMGNIPDSIKPRSDDDDDNDDLTRNSNLPAFADDVRRKKGIGGYVGFAAAFILFCSLFGYILASKDALIEKWPASAGFYQIVGFDIPVAGEGLIIEKASAKIVNKEGIDILLVSGTILNLKNNNVLVPKIVATLKSSEGGSSKIVDLKITLPIKEILDSGGIYKFRAEYKNPAEEFDSVNISFKVEL